MEEFVILAKLVPVDSEEAKTENCITGFKTLPDLNYALNNAVTAEVIKNLYHKNRGG